LLQFKLLHNLPTVESLLGQKRETTIFSQRKVLLGTISQGQAYGDQLLSPYNQQWWSEVLQGAAAYRISSAIALN